MMAVPIPSKVQMAAMSSKIFFIVLSPLADNMFFFCSFVNKIKSVAFQQLGPVLLGLDNFSVLQAHNPVSAGGQLQIMGCQQYGRALLARLAKQ